ncbi:hypothetical protein FOCC_FOCC017761, partial [Frankliniella occidentalis]
MEAPDRDQFNAKLEEILKGKQESNSFFISDEKYVSSEQCPCGTYIHKACSVSGKCNLCSRKEGIAQNREGAHAALSKQAERMLATSQKLHKPAEVGDTITMSVPLVDRGKGDARNVVAVVLDKTDDGYYRVGNQDGTVKNLLSRNQFDVSKERILRTEDVSSAPKSKRNLATAASLLGGQGFQR